MAGGLNKVLIIGNLGDAPEVKFAPSGDAVCNLSVATNESWTDKKTNEKQERTEWHRVTVWGKQAENCGKYLSKGSKVFVEGSLQTRSWEKDGVKRYTTEIKARDVQFLDSKGDGQGRSSGNDSGGGARNTDDIPF